MTRTLTWRISTAVRRLRHHEFWPAWLFYVPLLPWCVWLSMRYRSPLAFLAANPGIEKGGGWVNESKGAILDGLCASETGRRCTLAHVVIPPGSAAEERAAAAAAAIRANPALGGYPIILKPDAGQRGFAIKVARREADLLPYFTANTRAVMLQRFHAGPMECGVLWVRRAAGADAQGHRGAGFIFAITRKVFPVITGDGVRTVESLILDHPRYRCQADVFCARWRTDLGRVPAKGEMLRLAEAGNHCQGTLFCDGMDLATPELEAVIDAIASGFRGVEGKALDFGRFDIRYESDEQLRRGVGLAIVELNGTSSEATSLYDPARGPLWAYGLLLRQWAHLYRLGAMRQREGCRGMTAREVWREMRAHFHERPGSSLAD